MAKDMQDSFYSRLVRLKEQREAVKALLDILCFYSRLVRLKVRVRFLRFRKVLVSIPDWFD